MIESVEDLINKTNIRAFVHIEDIIKGKNYNENIELKVKTVEGGKRTYHYEVDAHDELYYFDVYITLNSMGAITGTLCDCGEFKATQSCPHVGAVLTKNYKDIFTNVSNDSSLLSESILNRFMKYNKNVIKKELLVSLNISFEKVDSMYYYYNDYIQVNVKLCVGEKKLYILKKHIRDFKEAYYNKEGQVYFGKDFIYDGSKYYLNESNKKVLEAYFDYVEMDGRRYNHEELKRFLEHIKDYKFVINNYEVDGIIDGFPIDTSIKQNNNDYDLYFDLEGIGLLIYDDYEYVFYKGKLYHLTNSEQELIECLIDHRVNNLVIKKDSLNKFKEGLLNVVRNKLSIDSNVTDLVLPNNIKTKLYFDIRSNYIECSIKLLYDTLEVDYFDNFDNVLRDNDYENEVINDLVKFGFIVNKNIILEDLEKQVEFLEQGIEDLANKYEVFTTEKFKKVNIKKKTNISSMFSIGTDNILNYNFDLGDINSNELVNIFKSLKDKKKYYKLKNGDILSLQDDALNELKDLSNDLELSDEDIRRGKGSILKYRAIYLDSLKNTKYNIINTNNLFTEFISKFYQYKDVSLMLDKEDLSILRDYQLTGVKWLKTIDKTGFGGILADEMGLGKTIQVIYYIKEMLKEANYKFLIVVPTSLAYNWAHEFLEFGSDVNIVVSVGSKENRKNILENSKASVYITTYGLLREDEEYYKSMNFHAIIIDEAQTIKNNNAGITRVVKSISADTKFALTGTPLENSVLELWSIFDYIMPGYLANLTKFQKKYKMRDFDNDSEELLKGLSKQINPFILRRKKKDVIKELPDKLVNDIYIDLDSEDKKVYVAELNKVKEEMDKVLEEDGISKARFLILQLLTKLRQICISPSLVYEDYKSDSTKILEVERIVKEYIENNHKILIFSSFKKALNLLKDRLEKNKIKVFMIDGSVSSKTRMELVTEFNESDEVKVFLVMLKSGGTGLNLTAADIVIHLDLWWNPQAENQATDRAHRIGQKNTVEVIHLITKGTIEEKILELQNKKRILSDKLIDGEIRDKNLISSLTKEDIENLLSYENQD